MLKPFLDPALRWCFCRRRCHRLEQMTQRFVNSSGPIIRLQVPRRPARPHAGAGHALCEGLWTLSHVVTLSFRCHATCQSLSTQGERPALSCSHTSAANASQEAKLQAVVRMKLKLRGKTHAGETYQVTTRPELLCRRGRVISGSCRLVFVFSKMSQYFGATEMPHGP